MFCDLMIPVTPRSLSRVSKDVAAGPIWADGL